MKLNYNLWKGAAVIAVAFLAAGCSNSSGGSYTNTTYHYSFKYPSGWTLYTSANLDPSVDKSTASTAWVNKDVPGTAQSDFRFFIGVDGKNPTNLSPDQWYANKKPGDSFVYPSSAISAQEVTTFAGSPAYKLTDNGGGGYTYFVSHGGVMFVVLVEENSTVTSDIQSNFDYIINSFTFTN